MVLGGYVPVLYCLVYVLQDFDAMTEDQQMAFAIQMSLHGNQTGVYMHMFVHVHACMCVC